ncbi:hypothetical protein AMTRI_Chr05g70600 [Amborella trichopoda]
MLTEVMMMMLFFFEFYLGYHIRLTTKTYAKAEKRGFGYNLCTSIALSSIHCKNGIPLLADSMLNLTSHKGEIPYKVILNGYLRGRMIRSDSRLFPPMLVHGSRPSCSEYHKLSKNKIGPCEVVQKINDNACKSKLPSHICTSDVLLSSISFHIVVKLLRTSHRIRGQILSRKGGTDAAQDTALKYLGTRDKLKVYKRNLERQNSH